MSQPLEFESTDEVYLPLDGFFAWPEIFPRLEDPQSIHRIWIQTIHLTGGGAEFVASTRLLLEGEIELGVPGLDAVALVLGGGDGNTTVDVEVELSPTPSLTLHEVPVTLRIRSDVLRPARRVPDDGPARFEVDPARDFVDVTLGAIGLTISAEGGLSIQLDVAIDLPPCLIGDTGIALQATDISLHLDGATPPAGMPAGWRGVTFAQAALYLPGELADLVGQLTVTDAAIGHGGFSGSVQQTWPTPLVGELGGVAVALQSAQITFVQNTLTAAELAAELTLPFFDAPIDATVGFLLDGGFTVRLGQSSGLFTVTRPGLLELTVDSLAFELVDGRAAFVLSGGLTPLVRAGDLQWPTFAVRELRIDADGNVALDGGWLDLPDQISLGFYGFQVEISRLGFGRTDAGERWIGLSGALKLVDGLSAGASVEGLRIRWRPDLAEPPSIDLDGVGVELEVPDVLRFSGAIAFREIDDGTSITRQFDGAIALELLALDLQVDAVLVVGTRTTAQGTEPYMGVYLGLELPTGLPLWATGVSLYGMAGLFTLQMEPDRDPAEPWYGQGGTGWYNKHPEGVTSLPDKWRFGEDALGLGAGVTLGTTADNGYAFNGRMLFAIVFPGPILLVEGRGNILAERASLSEDPAFRALLVLDGRAGTMQFGLDARYRFGGGGEVIDVRGGAEAFFRFDDPGAWHLYLGEDQPMERRIRAEVLGFLDANAYFMLSARRLRMGAWVGYAGEWDFGPLHVALEAWMEGGADLSVKPLYFQGHLWLHGRFELSAFGVGLGLRADARLDAGVFDPLLIKASLEVALLLPWPLPDLEAEISLEWSDRPLGTPAIPTPLQEVALAHPRSALTWPLRRGALLLPDIDRGDGFLLPRPLPSDATTQPPADAPVVPLDARPQLTFGRPVNDDAMIGQNVSRQHAAFDPPGWELIGDPLIDGPAIARFGLARVALERYDGAQWIVVAASDAADPDEQLYGSWRPAPPLPDDGEAGPVQNQLLLWTVNPFELSRHTGGQWEERLTERFEDFPCPPPPPDRRACCDFDDRSLGEVLPVTYPFPSHPALVALASLGPPAARIEEVFPRVEGHARAACFDGSVGVAIVLAQPGRSVSVLVSSEPDPPTELCALLDSGPSPGPNPRDVAGVVVEVYDGSGAPLSATQIVTLTSRPGLDLAEKAVVTLPCLAEEVELVYTCLHSNADVQAIDDSGAVVDQQMLDQGDEKAVVLRGSGIAELQVSAQSEASLHSVCLRCPADGTVRATAEDSNGVSHGPWSADGSGRIEIAVAGVVRVDLVGPSSSCLIALCATFPPTQSEVDLHSVMVQHTQDALTRWASRGEVLEPHRHYRLVVETTLEVVGREPIESYHEVLPIIREHAYFRTEGPPGLAAISPPDVTSSPDDVAALVGDLTPYVARTAPERPRGEKAHLPRPVYRAYDVGVDFSEDYVDLMYRLAGRDLQLHLFDVNDRPLRDAQGRLLAQPNRWGETETRYAHASEQRFLSTVDTSSCVTLEEADLPRRVRVSTASSAQVLRPDLPHEARLVPLLLHESFRAVPPGTEASGPGARLGGWEVRDDGDREGPSRWTVRGHDRIDGDHATVAARVDGNSVLALSSFSGSGDLSAVEPGSAFVELPGDRARVSPLYRILDVDVAQSEITVEARPSFVGGSSSFSILPTSAVVQSSNIQGGSTDADDPHKPGTVLFFADDPALPPSHPDRPSQWTDVRFSAILRAGDDDALGLVVRYTAAGDGYRASLDRERGYLRLAVLQGGGTTELDAIEFVYQQDQDYLLAVEAIGDRLQVYLDGEVVLRATDARVSAGTVGLYTWAHTAARFSVPRVEDFRATAPVVYRFPFVTSRFAHVAHHLHSYRGIPWDAGWNPADAGPQVQLASLPDAPLAEPEARAYDAVAQLILGQAAATDPPILEIHRILEGAVTAALLVRSPEPLDWARTTVTLASSSRPVPPPEPPGRLRITGAAFGAGAPNAEQIELLSDDAIDLAGVTLELREMPGALSRPPSRAVLLQDGFTEPRGRLWSESFGPYALGRYAVVDQGSGPGASAWALQAGGIVETSGYGAGPADASPDKPGAVAIVGDSRWSGVRVRAVLRNPTDGGIGVVFRYTDDDNHYRYSMDRQRGFRRLVKRVDGVVTVLWESADSFVAGQAHELEIEAVDGRIVGWLDHAALFDVPDDALRTGRAGLYAWSSPGARFEAFEVTSLHAPSVLWSPPLDAADAAERFLFVDEGNIGASLWLAANGSLQQLGSLWGGSFDPTVPDKPGALALGPAAEWGDVRIDLRLRSDDDDALGLVFRFVDLENYYRLSLDHQGSYRRLIKRVGGVVTTLWEDPVPGHTPGQSHDLEVRAEGPRLRAWLDGSPLFDLDDGDLAAGRVGLYTWSNTAASFQHLQVVDLARRLGPWRIVDEATTQRPSVWRTYRGTLLQESEIGEPTLPDGQGTLVVAGDPAWTDYRLTARLRSDEEPGIGLVVRHQAPGTYYRVTFDAKEDVRQLVRSVDGKVDLLDERTGGHRPGATFTATFEAIGERLRVFVNGALLFDVVDAEIASGAVGLYARANPGARFDDVEVRRPGLDAWRLFRDRFAVQDLTPWTFVDETTVDGPAEWGIEGGELRQLTTAHTLPTDRQSLHKPGAYAFAGDPTWTDVLLQARVTGGSQGALGLIFRHQGSGDHYRLSMDDARSYRRLVKVVGGQVSLLWEADDGLEPGRRHAITVLARGSTLAGWIDDVPMFEVDDDALANGQIGVYAWGDDEARFEQIRVLPAAVAFDDWALDEDFAYADLDRWQLSDEGSIGASLWSWEDGELRQTGSIWGGAAADPLEIAKPGTQAVAGSDDWADYRLVVHLRSDDDDGIGVLFRYLDDDNYLRLSMDAQLGFRRLVKKVQGQVTELWADLGAGYQVGVVHVVTVECEGDRLAGWLDGALLFEVRDADRDRGKVGLYAWSNTGARFLSVRVGTPAWTGYHTFGREPTVPAGTRLRIHAGNEADAPAAEPLVHARFAATGDDPGAARLPGHGADLRLIDAEGAVLHARRVLPDEAFTDVTGLEVLRARDGTGLLLVAPGPAPSHTRLPDGTLRLTFTALRRPADPDALVSTEGGHDGPEVVVLDVSPSTS